MDTEDMVLLIALFGFLGYLAFLAYQSRTGTVSLINPATVRNLG